MEDFKPIFMIGPCLLESEETERKQKQNRIVIFDKEKPYTNLEKIEEEAQDFSLVNKTEDVWPKEVPPPRLPTTNTDLNTAGKTAAVKQEAPDSRKVSKGFSASLPAQISRQGQSTKAKAVPKQ